MLDVLCLGAVEGVTVYISDFKRSLVDKLSKNFFSEPSQVDALPAERNTAACANSVQKSMHVLFHRDLASKIQGRCAQASVTCAATGPIRIKDLNRVRGSSGGEVFSESKGLNLFQNKTLRVRRLLDEAHKTLTYIAYSTRLSNSVSWPNLFDCVSNQVFL